MEITMFNFCPEIKEKTIYYSVGFIDPADNGVKLKGSEKLERQEAADILPELLRT